MVDDRSLPVHPSYLVWDATWREYHGMRIGGGLLTLIIIIVLLVLIF